MDTDSVYLDYNNRVKAVLRQVFAEEMIFQISKGIKEVNLQQLGISSISAQGSASFLTPFYSPVFRSNNGINLLRHPHDLDFLVHGDGYVVSSDSHNAMEGITKLAADGIGASLTEFPMEKLTAFSRGNVQQNGAQFYILVKAFTKREIIKILNDNNNTLTDEDRVVLAQEVEAMNETGAISVPLRLEYLHHSPIPILPLKDSCGEMQYIGNGSLSKPEILTTDPRITVANKLLGSVNHVRAKATDLIDIYQIVDLEEPAGVRADDPLLRKMVVVAMAAFGYNQERDPLRMDFSLLDPFPPFRDSNIKRIIDEFNAYNAFKLSENLATEILENAWKLLEKTVDIKREYIKSDSPVPEMVYTLNLKDNEREFLRKVFDAEIPDGEAIDSKLLLSDLSEEALGGVERNYVIGAIKSNPAIRKKRAEVLEELKQPKKTTLRFDSKDEMLAFFKEKQTDFHNKAMQNLVADIAELEKAIEERIDKKVSVTSGAEIEFLLRPQDTTPEINEAVIEYAIRSAHNLKNGLQKAKIVEELMGVLGYNFTKVMTKQGIPGFLEMVTPPQEAVKTAEQMTLLKSFLSKACELGITDVRIENTGAIEIDCDKDYRMFADFGPKPKTGHGGMGGHVHMSIVDEDGQNIFANGNGDLTENLYYALSGILTFLCPATTLLWVSDSPRATTQNFLRIADGAKLLAPTKIDAGFDSTRRSPAVRVRDVSVEEEQREGDAYPAKKYHAGKNTRIELRTPSAATDYALSIGMLAEGALHGIKERSLIPCTFREDERHSAQGLQPTFILPFPDNVEDALKMLKDSDYLRQKVFEINLKNGKSAAQFISEQVVKAQEWLNPDLVSSFLATIQPDIQQGFLGAEAAKRSTSRLYN